MCWVCCSVDVALVLDHAFLANILSRGRVWPTTLSRRRHLLLRSLPFLPSGAFLQLASTTQLFCAETNKVFSSQPTRRIAGDRCWSHLLVRALSLSSQRAAFRRRRGRCSLALHFRPSLCASFVNVFASLSVSQSAHGRPKPAHLLSSLAQLLSSPNKLVSPFRLPHHQQPPIYRPRLAMKLLTLPILLAFLLSLSSSASATCYRRSRRSLAPAPPIDTQGQALPLARRTGGRQESKTVVRRKRGGERLDWRKQQGGRLA